MAQIPNKKQNKNTRYFIEIDLDSLKIVKCSYDDREEVLDKGRQNDPKIHRLFLTLGQYNKFVSRCGDELASVLE